MWSLEHKYQGLKFNSWKAVYFEAPCILGSDRILLARDQILLAVTNENIGSNFGSAGPFSAGIRTMHKRPCTFWSKYAVIFYSEV